MAETPKGKSAGMKRDRSRIFAPLGGALACAMLLLASYACKAFAGAVPADTTTRFPTLAPTDTSAPYIPAPSLTGWVTVSGTQVTITPTPPPTSTPSLTSTPSPTSTPRPSSTPKPTNTPEGAPTETPIPPTPTVAFGTYDNPTSIGSGFTIPDLGTLTVVRSSWAPAQTGLVVVELSFTCGRAADQFCDTGALVLTAIGGSGTRYRRTFNETVPGPGFGVGPGNLIRGGATDAGIAGFSLENSESNLMMQVQIFQRAGQFYLWLGAPGGG